MEKESEEQVQGLGRQLRKARVLLPRTHTKLGVPLCAWDTALRGGDSRLQGSLTATPPEMGSLVSMKDPYLKRHRREATKDDSPVSASGLKCIGRYTHTAHTDIYMPTHTHREGALKNHFYKLTCVGSHIKEPSETVMGSVKILTDLPADSYLNRPNK